MKKLFLLCLTVAALSACADNPATERVDVNPAATIDDTFAVPLHEAIGAMDEVMNKIYGPERERAIASVEILKGGGLTPSGFALPENVAYIVNFTNNAGYAILGADRRLIPVLRLAESGTMTVKRMLETGLAEEIYSMFERMETRIVGCDWEYVGHNNTDDRNSCWDTDCDGIADWPTSPDTIGGSGVGNNATQATYIVPDGRMEYLEMIYYNKAGSETPLLTTNWHVGAPFNQIRFESNDNGSLETDFLLSQAIALAQIFAFHGSPDPSVFGVTSTWKRMKEINYDGGGVFVTTPDLFKVIKKIGEGIRSYRNGIRSEAECIAEYIKSLNTSLINVEARSFEMPDGQTGYVVDMLKSRCPVLLISDFVSSSGLGLGKRASLIDGYLYQEMLDFPIRRTLFNITGVKGNYSGWCRPYYYEQSGYSLYRIEGLYSERDANPFIISKGEFSVVKYNLYNHIAGGQDNIDRGGLVSNQ